ncbi:MAG: hypothetical protein WBF34_27740 [Streptosporangiaceae bacterium]|jgi:hypothetical protein
MSEFEQEPSANTGRFRAFVERGEDDASRSRRSPVSPAVLIVAGVVIIAIIIVIVVLA